ncbi:hypothetical protein F3Y22_tig00117034pilonHSYRG01399 [Hibiscus syriacus]|uniref:Uncharacterized protein n=1 Tax=Hibiscus syriacus TaxID=106335 RepID=A0A6A2WN69_HIBSY|nr:hypothetical protein F3Y22_tig00117034pilonHSYRG01399 [Hibiscus syriacus]
MKIVLNIIKLSSFSIAKSSRGTTGCHSTPTATDSNLIIDHELLQTRFPGNRMSEKPQSSSKPRSIVMQPGRGNEEKRGGDVDGMFSAYIRKRVAANEKLAVARCRCALSPYGCIAEENKGRVVSLRIALGQLARALWWILVGHFIFCARLLCFTQRCNKGFKIREPVAGWANGKIVEAGSLEVGKYDTNPFSTEIDSEAVKCVNKWLGCATLEEVHESSFIPSSTRGILKSSLGYVSKVDPIIVITGLGSGCMMPLTRKVKRMYPLDEGLKAFSGADVFMTEAIESFQLAKEEFDSSFRSRLRRGQYTRAKLGQVKKSRVESSMLDGKWQMLNKKRVI